MKTLSVTIQMKATKKCFLVVLFIVLLITLRPKGSCCGTREGNDKEQKHLLYPRYQQRKYAETLTETATQELDSTVTVDAAPIQ